ncbi:MAG: hypothetical protein V3T41_08220 [bacterium]
MAFIRFKGPYAYLVENERRKVGGRSYVRQRVLYYLGREPAIDDAVIAEVESRFPDAAVDWGALKEELAGGRVSSERKPVRRRPPRPDKRKRKEREDEWLEWD